MTLSDQGICRSCGCSDERACVRVDLLGFPETCSWAEPDLCTACADDFEGDGWLHPADQPTFTAEENAHEALGENDV